MNLNYIEEILNRDDMHRFLVFEDINDKNAVLENIIPKYSKLNKGNDVMLYLSDFDIAKEMKHNLKLGVLLRIYYDNLIVKGIIDSCKEELNLNILQTALTHKFSDLNSCLDMFTKLDIEYKKALQMFDNLNGDIPSPLVYNLNMVIEDLKWLLDYKSAFNLFINGDNISLLTAYYLNNLISMRISDNLRINVMVSHSYKTYPSFYNDNDVMIENPHDYREYCFKKVKD